VRKRRRIAFLSVFTSVSATLIALLAAVPAWAHGSLQQPGSRTFLCYEDGIGPTGQIQPLNPACAAAVNVSGVNSLYNWFAVLRSDGAGRTAGFIPDGKLCSGGNPNYAGFDLPSASWPVTHLTAGGNFEFRWNKWAAHPATISLYVTNDGWDPTKPLTWSELGSKPFATVTNPSSVGPVGSLSGWYTWNAALPANKTGQQIIYAVFARSDSTETFYSCSDVVFDGGTGQVTGVGQQGPPGSGQPCTATYAITSKWTGGYQAQVTVTNAGTGTLVGWTVSWTPPAGDTIVSAWDGTFSQSGTLATMRSADFNFTIPVGGSTGFGLVASNSATPTPPALTCSSP
jgi:chitin-binding protein